MGKSKKFKNSQKGAANFKLANIDREKLSESLKIHNELVNKIVEAVNAIFKSVVEKHRETVKREFGNDPTDNYETWDETTLHELGGFSAIQITKEVVQHYY